MARAKDTRKAPGGSAAAAAVDAADTAPGLGSALSACAEGSRLLLRAQPKAGSNEIAGLREGRLLVRVTAAPEDGKANAAIIKLLSKALSIPASAMEISAGQTSRDKTLTIYGYAPGEIQLQGELKL